VLAARQTPNLEDQWLEPSNSRHQVSPTSETTRGNPSSGRWNYGREISGNFAESGDFHVTFDFFYMPHIYGMGPTALFPLRRKACWGFFGPKNPTASAGFEPANLGTIYLDTSIPGSVKLLQFSDSNGIRYLRLASPVIFFEWLRVRTKSLCPRIHSPDVRIYLQSQYLGGSSPLCALTSILTRMWVCTSNTTIFIGVVD